MCPRCRQWLTVRSFRNPLTNLLGIALPMVLLLGLIAGVLIQRLDRILNPRPFYGDMPESLGVTASHMNWIETTNGPRIYVIGILTNRSLVAWKDVEFQCRFFDGEGHLIDAGYPTARLTILAYSDAAFRGVITPAQGKSDYHALTVTVSSARNARSHF